MRVAFTIPTMHGIGQRCSRLLAFQQYRVFLEPSCRIKYSTQSKSIKKRLRTLTQNLEQLDDIEKQRKLLELQTKQAEKGGFSLAGQNMPVLGAYRYFLALQLGLTLCSDLRVPFPLNSAFKAGGLSGCWKWLVAEWRERFKSASKYILLNNFGPETNQLPIAYTSLRFILPYFRTSSGDPSSSALDYFSCAHGRTVLLLDH